MDWEVIAPMIAVVTLFLSAAGVLIFRPLTKRLGDLIEVTSRNRQTMGNPENLARLTEAVGRLAERIELLEERQDFTERVLSSTRQERTGKPGQLER
jgi:hypothetical protein